MEKVSSVKEVIDSQFIAENVGFLENDFETSFSLQFTLNTVKEYVTEENFYTPKETRKTSLSKKIKTNDVSQATGSVLDASTRSRDSLSQCKTGTKISKNLKDWGLPLAIAQKYEERQIIEMFDWQVECLGNPKVLLHCNNLVYSAPTSAGKTLVAEILTIKTVLERQKKVIIILPFVSIVREKMFYLQDILSSSGIRVEGFMGSQSPPGGLQAVHVAICTIEKANSIINKLLDDGNISELGAVVVDELHLLGDPHRGYILELLLTKIKFVCLKLDVSIQIIGMSATLPNLKILANWLDAELFITEFRPIPLDEYCLIGTKLFDKTGKVVNIMDKDTATGESDNVLEICLNTIKDGCSVLIFCMTKNRCENLAQSIASSFYKLGCSGVDMGLILRKQLNTDSILEVLEQLKNCSVGIDKILKTTISFGVAYHHAGLTFDERDIIEGGFKSGAIRVLVATSTLSSGVNLPARKVIVRSPVFQRQPINILTYKQMIGRAGRMGRDTKGESILICTEAEKNIGFELMMGALDPVLSCIDTEDKYMRAVLEMIASQVVSTKDELDLYSKCTLLFVQQNKSLSQNILLNSTLDQLVNYELVRVQADGEDNHYAATPLGKACLSSSMAPNDGLSLFCELQKARQCLVLETDLHLIYLVTPYSVSSQWGNIDWLHLLTLWESLTRSMKRVGELVGVQESFIIRCLRGNNKLNNIQNKMNIHKRFYTALALQDLVSEIPLSEVAAKFQCARGFLQSLQQAAATFAGMVTAFCRQLGWKNMEMLITQFQDRLHFGIHSELVELMKLSTLNGVRARTLFDSGYETIASIASAGINAIENALHKSVPFQSSKEREGDYHDDIRKRNKIRNIWITGCCGMTAKEAAENLILEARKYLKLEIGVAEIKWEDSSMKKINVSQTTDTDERHNCIEPNLSNKIKPLISATNEYLSQKLNGSNNLQVSSININDEDKHSTTTSKSIELEEKNNVNVISKLINNNEIFLISNNGNISDNAITVIQDIERSKVTTNYSLSTIAKDDLTWDSLYFTEPENGTKLLSQINIQSPNLSFGDSEDKTLIAEIVSLKKSPANDISLFSSDGDNSSLFEESLQLESISSKLFDKESTEQMSKLKKVETTSDYINIESNTLLNAFKSTIIEIESDEDIKLIYDDENKMSENELEVAFNESEEVPSTVEVSETSIRNVSITPIKRQADFISNNIQPAKKLKTDGDKCHSNFKIENILNLCALKLSGQSMKCTVVLENFKFDYVVLRGKDIVDNVDVLTTLKDASVYVRIYANTTKNEVIGSRVLKDRKANDNDKAVNTIIQDAQVISICFGHECVLLDLTFLDNMLKQKLSHWFQNPLLRLKVMSLRHIYMHVKKYFHVDLILPRVDVSLFEWLSNSDEKIPDIIYLTKKYCNVDLSNISIKINGIEKKFNKLDTFEEACVRAWCVWTVAEKQEKILLQQYDTIKETLCLETQVLRILSSCEFHGLTVDKDLASQLLIDVKNSQETLQKKAYKISGYHFNFNSSKDVAKVLGIYKGRKVSTKKCVLTSHNTPISSIVIYWRKLNSILTKTLYPLTQRACIYSAGDRINPSYTMFTCTGRVSMHEPNLQNVPRTFTIPVKYLATNETNTDDVMEFNCRNIFRAAPGHLLVSADYCQLEMRILTHYSGDPVLMNIMNSDVDVFKSIAASWSNLPEKEVDDDLRQKAKQLCYGILYGMGNRTLAQHLDVTELEAAMFMDSFYKTYPSVRAFTQSVINDCRRNGYVKTLMKRQRFLPDINSHFVHKKSAAERQAVNTTIQGSAADIAKAAMCAIDNRTNGSITKPRLILQMHDELIYEVPESAKASFITLIREVMEQTVHLKVPLPVKVKCGYTWGSLEEVKGN
ncbi:DNA polymerase theta-like [Achroia grisella]|uniref:DNA polymerase theta-like n=1 Tax=Achroia grisella TaxID=688607 RepID=UPI0027D269A3|nr:DNA polymerase theta-like [Achroia grisella]